MDTNVSNFFCIKRSSHRGCSIEKGVIKNFAKFTGMQLCRSLIFDKFSCIATLSKNSIEHRYFSANFCKIFKNTFFTEHFLTPPGDCFCIDREVQSYQINDWQWKYPLFNQKIWKLAEAVVWKCSVKKVIRKFRKIHRKTPVPETLFY